MMQRFLSSKRLFALTALATAVVAAVGACGTDPTPTATPAPTSTPTPTPSPVLLLPVDAVWGDVVDLLPEPTQMCVRDSAGTSYDSQLATPIFSSVDLYLSDFPIGCLPQETVVDLVIANLLHEAGGLRADSVTCIRGAFSNVDLPEVFAASGDSEASSRGIIAGVLGMLLCLTDDEASRISVSGLFDMGEVSLQDLRCVVQLVDIGALVNLLIPADPIAGGEPPDLAQAVELLAALEECGVDLSGPAGVDGPSTLPPLDLPGVSDTPGPSDTEELPPEVVEAVACLIDVLGEEKVAAIMEGTYAPTPEDLSALSACDLDAARIMGLLEQAQQ